jgi:Tfp pilus assembly protein PilP
MWLGSSLVFARDELRNQGQEAMMRPTRIVLPLLLIGAAVAAVLAQPAKPAAKPGAKPAATGTTTSTTSTTSTTGTATATDTGIQQSLQEILEEPATGETYHYDPQGRRDPFQSLIGPAPKRTSGQVPGPPGFLIDEIKLQGIVRTREQGLVAMVNGPDNKGYLMKVGQKVLDGEVIRMTASTVVFRQEVNDPTRIERFREVVKDLSPETKKP